MLTLQEPKAILRDLDKSPIHLQLLYSLSAVLIPVVQISAPS